MVADSTAVEAADAASPPPGPAAAGSPAGSPRRSPPQNPTRRLLGRALAILGLSSVAVVQPMLDLFGRNPEFFVAGNYSAAQIVWFAVAVALVPPAIAIVLVALAGRIHRRAGDAAFAVVVALFAGALALAVLRVVGIDPVALVAPLALLAALGLTWLIVRVAGFGMLATYLAAANLLFVGMFLFASPASKLVAAGGVGGAGNVTVGEVEAPVIVIVLDEFPVASLLRPDGTINEERYPGFADLASVSTWFRNASSIQNLTHRAVPAILTGTRASGDVLPIAADYPQSMFTYFGAELPVHRYESVTDMCPPRICEQQASQGFGQLVEDAAIVYGHRLLPTELRDRLPAIDNSWGAFGAQQDRGVAGAAPAGTSAPGDDDSGDDGAGDGALASSSGDGSSGPRTEQQIVNEAYQRWYNLAADEKSPVGQARILAEHIELIDGSPAFHFVHPALPHRPWILSRTGITTSFLPKLVTDETDPSYAFENRMEFQLSAMQIGAADVLMSQLLDHLRSLPTWEDTLLVVTSDHGTNLTPPHMGRMRITEANREEALRVPLFIKAPGQTVGAIDDRVALTPDVLPSMIDLLGGSADWDFDGHSLYDGSEPTLEPRVSPDVGALFEVAQRRTEDFPHGLDWTALAAVGDDGELVGRGLDEVTLGEPSDLTIEWAQEDEFASLPTPEGSMPFGLRGVVAGGSGETPPELLVAVNGTIAGVLGGYIPDGDVRWTFIGFVADLYVEGANTVDAYEVTRDAGGTPTLHLVARS